LTRANQMPHPSRGGDRRSSRRLRRSPAHHAATSPRGRRTPWSGPTGDGWDGQGSWRRARSSRFGRAWLGRFPERSGRRPFGGNHHWVMLSSIASTAWLRNHVRRAVGRFPTDPRPRHPPGGYPSSVLPLPREAGRTTKGAHALRAAVALPAIFCGCGGRGAPLTGETTSSDQPIPVTSSKNCVFRENRHCARPRVRNPGEIGNVPTESLSQNWIFRLVEDPNLFFSTHPPRAPNWKSSGSRENGAHQDRPARSPTRRFSHAASAGGARASPPALPL